MTLCQLWCLECLTVTWQSPCLNSSDASTIRSSKQLKIEFSANTNRYTCTAYLTAWLPWGLSLWFFSIFPSSSACYALSLPLAWSQCYVHACIHDDREIPAAVVACSVCMPRPWVYMNAVRTYIFQLLLVEVHRIRDTHIKLQGCFCRDYRHLRAASEFNTLSASIHAVARTTQVHTADASKCHTDFGRHFVESLAIYMASLLLSSIVVIHPVDEWGKVMDSLNNSWLARLFAIDRWHSAGQHTRNLLCEESASPLFPHSNLTSLKTAV